MKSAGFISVNFITVKTKELKVIHNIKYQPNIGNLLYCKDLIYSNIRVIHKVLNIQGFLLLSLVETEVERCNLQQKHNAYNNSGSNFETIKIGGCWSLILCFCVLSGLCKILFHFFHVCNFGAKDEGQSLCWCWFC